MGQFVANPEILRMKGKEAQEKSEEFKRNVDTIYNTINEMVTQNYLDPASMAIASNIASYRDDLNKMISIIRSYGEFCLTASAKVTNNQDNIISGIPNL